MENSRKITMVVWVAAGLMAGCHPGMDSLEESVAAPIAQEEEAASDEEGSSFEDETDFSEGSSDEWESDEDPTMDSEETDSGDDGEVNDEESEGGFGGDDTWWDEDESSEEGDVNEDETIAGERFNDVLGQAANPGSEEIACNNGEEKLRSCAVNGILGTSSTQCVDGEWSEWSECSSAPATSPSSPYGIQVHDEVVLDGDAACVTAVFNDHIVLNYYDGFTSHEEIFFQNDDYLRIRKEETALDCVALASPTSFEYVKATGAATCPLSTMVKNADECKKAGESLGHPFSHSVNQDASSFNGAGRPGGCFWDQNGNSYFNENLESSASWGGTGGICRSLATGTEDELATSNDMSGFETIDNYSEMCGKGCSSPGVTCYQHSPELGTTAACAAACLASDSCMGFQAPDPNNGFHGWCVTMDYVPSKATHNSPQHSCHDDQTTYALSASIAGNQ